MAKSSLPETFDPSRLPKNWTIKLAFSNDHWKGKLLNKKTVYFKSPKFGQSLENWCLEAIDRAVDIQDDMDRAKAS
jgi:hypothetical protein